jgi:hypothetical protein
MDASLDTGPSFWQDDFLGGRGLSGGGRHCLAVAFVMSTGGAPYCSKLMQGKGCKTGASQPGVAVHACNPSYLGS